MLASITTWLAHFHGPTVYVFCGLLVFAEDSLMLGFVIPGETAALVGGALAGGAISGLRTVNLEVMVVVVIASAIAGDSVGYEIGRLIGPWLLQTRLMRKNLGVHKARDLISRFGGPAVFLGRWVALARALVPGLSGMSRMRYRTFILFNVIGGITWGTTFVMIGYAAGKSYEKIAKTTGAYSALVVGAIALVVVTYVVARKRHERRERASLVASGELGGPGEPGEPGGLGRPAGAVGVSNAQNLPGEPKGSKETKESKEQTETKRS